MVNIFCPNFLISFLFVGPLTSQLRHIIRVHDGRKLLQNLGCNFWCLPRPAYLSYRSPIDGPVICKQRVILYSKSTMYKLLPTYRKISCMVAPLVRAQATDYVSCELSEVCGSGSDVGRSRAVRRARPILGRDRVL